MHPFSCREERAMNARRMNQNQRYEVLMHFPGYEGSPCGSPRVEYAAESHVLPQRLLLQKRVRFN